MRQASQQSLAAKEIRKILKSKFPNVQFKVKAESSNTSSSVSVYYEGVLVDRFTEDVREEVSVFQRGSFSGMDDSYTDGNLNDSIPQVQFVQVIPVSSFKYC